MAVQRIAPGRAAGGASTRLADPRKIRDAALAADETSAESLPIGIDERGQVLATARFDVRNPDAMVVEIGNLWRRAQEEFLAIGRCLVGARRLIETTVQTDGASQLLSAHERRMATEAEWRKFLDRLPFGQSIASQLERVARALDSGRLSREELPSNYSVAYQLTTLTDAELEAARRHGGIVGTTATRSRIVEFKRRLRQARLDRRDSLERRRQKVLEDIQRLQTELVTIERELANDGGSPAGADMDGHVITEEEEGRTV